MIYSLVLPFFFFQSEAYYYTTRRHVVKHVVMLAGIKLKVLLEAEHGSITGELFIFCVINLRIKE